MSSVFSMTLGLYIISTHWTVYSMLDSNEFSEREAATILIKRLAVENQNWLILLEHESVANYLSPEKKKRVIELRNVVRGYKRDHNNVFFEFDTRKNAEAAIEVLKKQKRGLPIDFRSAPSGGYNVIRVSQDPYDGGLIPFVKSLKGCVNITDDW